MTIWERVTAAGENNGINGNWEVATNAFDDTTGTKWLDFATNYPSTRQSWIQYQYANGQRYLVTEYTITSANDAASYPERNPADWRLLGSNNGGASWVTLDIHTNQVFTANFQKLAYSFTNTTAYNLYRFQIDRVANPAQAVAMQLDELEFLLRSVALLVLLVLRRWDHLHEPESATHLPCQWHLHGHAGGFGWLHQGHQHHHHLARPAWAGCLDHCRRPTQPELARLGDQLHPLQHDQSRTAGSLVTGHQRSNPDRRFRCRDSPFRFNRPALPPVTTVGDFRPSNQRRGCFTLDLRHNGKRVVAVWQIGVPAPTSLRQRWPQFVRYRYGQGCCCAR